MARGPAGDGHPIRYVCYGLRKYHASRVSVSAHNQQPESPRVQESHPEDAGARPTTAGNNRGGGRPCLDQGDRSL